MSSNKRFHFVDDAGQSRFADLTPAAAETVINNNATRTIFIRHQPSTSRNVVTIYKRVQEGQIPSEESNNANKKKKEGPSSFPYACSVCPNRFRNAFALLKHLNKVHYHRTAVEKAQKGKNQRRTNTSNTLHQLRSLVAPSGRILFTLLNQAEQGKTTEQQSEPPPVGSSYKCRFCSFRFVFRSQLCLHYKFHRRLAMAQRDRKLVCSVCQRIFVNRSSLFVHIRCCHPVTIGLSLDLEASFPAQCSLCFKRFRNEDELTSHVGNAHVENRSFSCEECSPVRHFRSAGELALHEKSHKKAKSYQCNLCNRRVSTRSNLARHMVLIHGDKKKKPVEEERVEFDPTDLPLNMVKCQICCRHFKTIEALIQHRRLRHSDGIDQPWQYLCQECGQRFQFPSQLAHHLKTAKGHNLQHLQSKQPKKVQFQPLPPVAATVQEPVTVDLTAYTEEEISAARERQQLATTEIDEQTRPLTANDEDWMIPLLSVGRLLEESSSRIDGVVADISGVSTDLDLPPNLMPEEDNGIQRDKGTFSCQTCSKQFSRLADANRHVRVVHAESRPFVCEVCEKSFKWRHSYVDHCRTHTGERPYVCEHCQASFTASGNLVRHKKHSHPSEAVEEDNRSNNADSNC